MPVTDKINVIASIPSRQKFRKSTGEPVLPANTTPAGHLVSTVSRMNKISGLGYVVVAAIKLCRDANLTDAQILESIEKGVR